MIADSPEFDILCMNCMQNKGSTVAPCPHCGCDERQQKSHPLYLQPRTLLKNQYLIGKPLGQGGFGITYVGLDKWLQKKVAIKEYLPSALATRDFLTSFIIPVKKQEDAFNKGLQLFIHEARHLAKFNHPNIVRVINFFEENQTGYMVMEYLEGDSPESILTQTGGRLPVAQALAIILPILDALTEVHAQHLYHCDISAQNLRILTTGVPILIDFGAARHIIGEQSRSLTVVLKHGYSPLEQYSGKGKIGPWTDIYACGALLYLMITGNLPPAATDRFGEDTLIAPINLPNVDISPVLNDAIIRALGIKLEDRFQTVPEFKAALEGKLTVTPPPILLPVPTPPRQVVSRSSKRLTAIMVLVMVSIGLFFYFNKNTVPVTHPPFLLDKAQTQWASGKLTAPPGDNVYETYQIILKVEPDNTLAKTGLLKLAEHFYNLARLAQERGQTTNSLEQVKLGLQVMPTHVKLLTLEQELMTSVTAQQQVQARVQQVQQQLDQAAHYLATAQLEAAYRVYQEVLATAPDNQQARAGLQQLAEKYEQLARTQKDDIVTSLAILEKGLTAFPKQPGLLSLKQELTKKKLTKQHELEENWAQQRQIEELLKIAQQQLLALRLTEPAGDNAYETYQQILNLAPNHQEANAGFINIANEYERLARIKQDNMQKNLVLIDKGLKVLPNHAGLLALRQTFTQPPPLPVAKVSTLVSTPPPKEISASVPAHHTTNVVPIPKVRELTTSKASIPEVKVIDLSKSKETLADQLVQKGLVIAKQQLEAGQFEEAIQTYQNVLQKAPNNKEATTGLQQIAHHYETLARQQTQENHWTESLSFINKGLTAAPTDVELLTLQGEVTRRLKNEQSPPKETKKPQNIIFTPSF